MVRESPLAAVRIEFELEEALLTAVAATALAGWDSG